MADRYFGGTKLGPADPAARWAQFAPSDTQELVLEDGSRSRAVLANSDGTLVLESWHGDLATVTVLIGQVVPFIARRVRAASTATYVAIF